MSNLYIHVSNLDIMEFGKNKTAKNSRLNLAFRIFFQIFIDLLVKNLDMITSKTIVRLDICLSRLDIRMSVPTMLVLNNSY